MKKILLILLSIAVIGYVMAQSAYGRYSSRKTQDGTIFFIMPMKLKKLSGISFFEYDMTLLNWTDSIVLNFTFESNSMSMPEDLKIISNDKDIICNSFSPLFVDIKKKNYEIRISAKFGISDFENILNATDSPKICFSQDGQIKQATYRESSWRDERKKLNDILQLYLHTK